MISSAFYKYREAITNYISKKGRNEISFGYAAIPKQALYFVGSERDDDLQIWTQGQGKYTSNWFPR
jgi:aminopeptidase N